MIKKGLYSLAITTLMIASTIFPNHSILANGDSNSPSAEEVIIPIDTIDYSAREVIINDGWKFYYGDASGAQATSYNDNSWREVTIPHDYSNELDVDLRRGEAESAYKLGGVGWYRRRLMIPTNLANKRVIVDFDGVYNNASIYINGTKIAEHPYGYSPFAVDLTDYLVPGSNNVLAVKVDHKFPSSRWYSGSGIFRDVKLLITDKVHVDYHGIVIKTENLKTEKDSDVHMNISTVVKNDTTDAKQVVVRQTLLNNNVEVTHVDSDSTSVNPNNSAKIETVLTVSQPTLWSTTNPHLYQVKTEILVDGQVVDTVVNDYGFRYFDFDANNGFSLNGQNMKLQGVSMHHDQGALGSRAYYDAIERQVLILKDMGVNSIRVTHNPAATNLIKAADKHGILLIEEFFDTWTNSKNGNRYDYGSFFDAPIGESNKLIGASSTMTWAEYDLKSTIKRGINSPAIIMWSTGNEIAEGLSSQRRFSEYPQIAAQLARWVNETDNTRPATIGDNKVKHGENIPTQMVTAIVNNQGIAGLNYANETQLQNVHRNHPEWKIYASETSSAVNSREVYNQRYNGNYSASRTSDQNLTSYDRSTVGWGHVSAQSWLWVQRNNFIAGEYVWTGFDYLGEPTPWNGTGAGATVGNNSPKSSYFGIVDITGFPKDRYYFYRSQWNKNDTTLHLLPNWNSDVIKDNRNNVDVVVYTNAKKVGLYFQADGEEATLIGEKEFTTMHTDGNLYSYQMYQGQDKSSRDFENLFFTFKVPYRAGKVFAKAYGADGTEITQTVGRKEIVANTAATTVEAKASKTDLQAGDLAYIEVDLKDANGHQANNANNALTVSTSGNSVDVIAVDNGQQKDHTPYTSMTRNAFNGKLLVIARANGKAGTTNITISGQGLTPKTISLNASASETTTRYVAVKMINEYLVPIGGQLNLSTDAKLIDEDGTETPVTIQWNEVTESLDSAKTFFVSGVIQDHPDIKVSATVTVAEQAVAILNYSTAVETGTSNITLPATRPAVLPNGKVTATQFKVTWNYPSDLTTKLASENTFEVPGTANVFGQILDVKATVRVSNGMAVEGGNTARGARVSQNIPDDQKSDTLEAIIDGTTNPPAHNGGVNPDLWSSYNWAQAGHRSAEITFAYDTNSIADKARLYVYTDNWSASVPSEIKVYVKKDGGDFTLVDNVTKLESGISNRVKKITLNFPRQEFLQIKLELVAPEGYKQGSIYHCVALTEVEFTNSSNSLVLSSNVLPEDLKVNGETVTNADLVNGMSVTDVDAAVKVLENTSNVAVTVVPKHEDKVKVILESEDHSRMETLEIAVGQEETPLPASSPKRDIDPATIEGNVASFQPGEEVAKALDNNESTLWHTKWNENLSSTPEKRYIELTLTEDTRIEAVRYLPRQSGTNGMVKQYRVEVEVDGSFQEVTSGTWEVNHDWKQATFTPIVTRKVRLYGVTTDTNNAFMSAAEIRVRKTRDEATSLTSGFEIQGVEESYTITTRSIMPNVRVVNTETQRELEKDIDYLVTYENNSKPGKGTVKVIGVANYKDSISKDFKITGPITKEFNSEAVSGNTTVANLEKSKINATVLNTTDNQDASSLYQHHKLEIKILNDVDSEEFNRAKAQFTTLDENNKASYGMFSIKLYDVSSGEDSKQAIQPLENTKFKITLPLSQEQFSNKDRLKLIHISATSVEEVSGLEFNETDKTVSFELTSFSTILTVTDGPTPQAVDKKAINAAITKAETKIAEGNFEDTYTTSSKANLKEKLKAAKTAREGENQEAINAATAALDEAYEQLAEKPSTQELREKISQAKAKQAEDGYEANYSKSSRTKLAEAITNAEAALISEDASEISRLKDELNTAIEGLEETITPPSIGDPVDYSTLDEKIAAAEAKMQEENYENKYTETTRNDLAEKLQAAKDAKSSQDQDAVNKAANDLHSATEGLALNPVVDKTPLIELIDELQDLDTTGYTADSIQSFTQALEAAKTEKDSDASTEDTVSTAISNLETAKNNLTVDKSELTALIASLDSTNTASYEAKTAEAFINKLEAAKRVKEDPNATVVDVANVIRELNTAYDNLSLDMSKLTRLVDAATKKLKDERKYYTAESLADFDNYLTKITKFVEDPNNRKNAEGIQRLIDDFLPIYQGLALNRQLLTTAKEKLAAADTSKYDQASLETHKKLLANVTALETKEGLGLTEMKDALTAVENFSPTLRSDADNSELVAMIKRAETKIAEPNYTETYTQASRDNLANKLAEAKNAKDSNNQNEINNAKAALETAINELTEKEAPPIVPNPTAIDYSTLDEKIRLAEERMAEENYQTKYSEETRNNLTEKLAKAKAAKTSEDQEAVNTAANNLETAINELTLAPVDKTELNKLVEELKDFDTTGYTSESVENFNNTLAAAKAEQANPDSTTETVAQAIADLTAAKEALKADKTALNEKLASIDNFDELKATDLLSPLTKNKLVNAHNEALVVSQEDDATVEKVAKALNDLTMAYNNLSLNKDKASEISVYLSFLKSTPELFNNLNTETLNQAINTLVGIEEDSSYNKEKLAKFKEVVNLLNSVEVNKDLFNKLISDFEAQDTSRYTDTSLNNRNAILKAAKEFVANPNILKAMEIRNSITTFKPELKAINSYIPTIKVNPEVKEEKVNKSIPNTGLGSMMPIYLGMAGVAVIGLFFLIFIKRRKDKK